jgi:hypothetical protein
MVDTITYIYMYTHTHTHIHTHTYIHTYIHTYVHSYIHTHIPKFQKNSNEMTLLYSILLIPVSRSTCFGVNSHPSSGARLTVFTASGVYKQCVAGRRRGWVGTIHIYVCDKPECCIALFAAAGSQNCFVCFTERVCALLCSVDYGESGTCPPAPVLCVLPCSQSV